MKRSLVAKRKLNLEQEKMIVEVVINKNKQKNLKIILKS